MEIIEQLKQHSQNSVQQTSVDTAALKPATIHEVRCAETLLKFSLPEIVKQLYLGVSNGGYGPGKGLFDIVSAANEYVGYRNDREYNQPEWPVQLLPVCDWGCDIYSCLDCSSSNAPVVRVDYNLDVPWIRRMYILDSDFQFFQPYSNDVVVAWIEAISLEKWLCDWHSGNNLFRAAYPKRKPKLEW